MDILIIKKKLTNRTFKEALAGYLFAFPAILGFLILTLYPMLASLFYSFNKINLKGTMRWIGFDNYINMFTDPTSEFKKSLLITVIYAVINVMLVMGWCLAVSLLLNRSFMGCNLLRAIFYLPAVIPMLATSILWKVILQNQAQGGLINQLLMFANLETKEWLLDTRLIFVTLFIMSIWTCGGTIIVFLATLQDVPEEQLESVELDGGNAWHKFKAVTLPTIEPVIFLQMLTCMITSIQVFTQSVALSSNGAPDRMTYFINVMIYDHAFRIPGARGLAAAEAWVVFLVILVFTGLLFMLQNRFDPNNTTKAGRRSIR